MPSSKPWPFPAPFLQPRCKPSFPVPFPLPWLVLALLLLGCASQAPETRFMDTPSLAIESAAKPPAEPAGEPPNISTPSPAPPEPFSPTQEPEPQQPSIQEVAVAGVKKDVPTRVGPLLEFTDAKGFSHKIPMALSFPLVHGEKISVEAKPADEERYYVEPAPSGSLNQFRFSFYFDDDTRPYYVEVRTGDQLLFVKDGDTLNGHFLQIVSKTRTAEGRPVACVNYRRGNFQGCSATALRQAPLSLQGIDFKVQHVSAADALQLISFNSVVVCEDSDCTRQLRPLDGSTDNRFYLSSGGVLETAPPRLVLRGNGGLQVSYLPVVVNEGAGGTVYFLLDDGALFETSSNETLEFLGTDLNGDNLIDAYEPGFLALPELSLDRYALDKRFRDFSAVFEIRYPKTPEAAQRPPQRVAIPVQDAVAASVIPEALP